MLNGAVLVTRRSGCHYPDRPETRAPEPVDLLTRFDYLLLTDDVAKSWQFFLCTSIRATWSEYSDFDQSWLVLFYYHFHIFKYEIDPAKNLKIFQSKLFIFNINIYIILRIYIYFNLLYVFK